MTLLFDLSNSMLGMAEQMFRFARRLVLALPVEEDITRVAAVTYDVSATIEFKLKKYKGKKLDLFNAMAFG